MHSVHFITSADMIQAFSTEMSGFECRRSSADPPSTFPAPVGFAPTNTLAFHCTCLLVYKLSCLLKQKSISIPDGKSTLPSEDISISRLEWQVLSFWPLMNTRRPRRGCFHLGRDTRRLWRCLCESVAHYGRPGLGQE